MTHMRTISLFILIFTTLQAFSQDDIADARTMAEGSTVTVTGIVTGGEEFNTSLRYIQDASAGIAIYDPSLDGILLGDEITVSGELTLFNNLLEIVNVSSVAVEASNQPLPAPNVQTLGAGFTENFEAQLMQFDNVTFIETGTFVSGSANYQITDGSQVKDIRVWASTDLAGSPIPSETISIIGLMGQYQDTYQLQPRAFTDLIFGGAPVFSTEVKQENITQNSFDVTFETINPGNTVINYSINPGNLSAEVSDMAFVTDHTLSLSNLSPGTIYFVQATSISSTGEESQSGVYAMATESESSGDIKVYFNNPVDHSVATDELATYVNNAMADTLIAFINSATESIDMCIYNIDNDNNIIDAINAAIANGIDVRIVADYEVNSTTYSSINTMNKRKSPQPGFQNAPGGGSYKLMHNKFLVLDADATDPMLPKVWSGSMNFTDNQVNSASQNSIIIQDQSLARAYRLEFEEMYIDNVFGPEKKNNTPHEFVIGGNRAELYFSPSDDTEQKIKDAVLTANSDIEVAMFSYTRFGVSFDIADALASGAFVAGMVEDTTGGDFAFDVIADETPGTWLKEGTSNQLHHKYMIVDAHDTSSDPLVLTGSHNWSSSANFSNDENTLIVHNATVANLYYQEWRKRYTDNGGSIFVSVLEDWTGEILSDIRIKPNPVHNSMQIQNIDINDVAAVQVFSSTGSLIMDLPVSTDLQYNLGLIEDGFYLISVLFNDGSSASAKVIKN